MRLEVRPHARDPIFLSLAEAASDQNDRSQNPRKMAMSGPPKPGCNQQTCTDEHGRLAEKSEGPCDIDQQRMAAGVQCLKDLSVERSAAEIRHSEPDRSERNYRRTVAHALPCRNVRHAALNAARAR